MLNLVADMFKAKECAPEYDIVGEFIKPDVVKATAFLFLRFVLSRFKHCADFANNIEYGSKQDAD